MSDNTDTTVPTQSDHDNTGDTWTQEELEHYAEIEREGTKKIAIGVTTITGMVSIAFMSAIALNGNDLSIIAFVLGIETVMLMMTWTLVYYELIGDTAFGDEYD